MHCILRKESEDYLTLLLQNLKEQRNRHEQFSQGPVASSLPPSALTGFHRGNQFFDSNSTVQNKLFDALVTFIRLSVN